MIVTKNAWHSGIKVLFVLLCLKIIQVARTECRIGDWVCDDGQCIPINRLCDGKVDCSDRSDEIAENCMQQICPKDTFRCANGRCVSVRDNCNEVRNCADNSDESIFPEKRNIDPQGTCAAHQRQCLTSKECIDKSVFCNGISNCQDGSDESPEVCLNLKCTQFQCGNGACISEKLKCNGKAECLDGSDEAWQLCNKPQKGNNFTSLMHRPQARFKRQTTNCLLPNFPELQNLKFTLHPQNETIHLGQTVENYEAVYVECKNDGILIGAKSLLCRNGVFTPDFPNCNYCDKQLLNKLSLRANCIINRVFQKCPNKILPGTSIRVICAYGYSRQPSNELGMKCLQNGKFDQIVPSCKMNCGILAHNAGELSKNGIPIVVSEAPWHVAIYENIRVRYVYICGGSVISPSIIISAAHCFYDEAFQVQKDSENFQIIAGRNTSLYSPESTEYAQVVNVTEVIISLDYKGKEDGQIDDIAFLKLEVPLQFSKTIAPICLDNSLRNRASKYMRSNRDGFMTGYGDNNQLERVNMKTLEFHECKLRSPKDTPVVDDKFCAYPTHNAFVCRGDSGGGFVTGQTDEDSGLTTYKFWGVISNTPIANSDCTRADNQSFVAITNIFFTESTFKKKLTDARRKDELLIENPLRSKNCYLPNTIVLWNILFKQHPHNHTIELGSSVKNLETIHAECKNGGTLTGGSRLTCRYGEWNVEFPSCPSPSTIIAYCDGTLLNNLSLKPFCELPGKEFRLCPAKISPGTNIRVQCAYGYSRLLNAQHEIKCLPNGSFDKLPTPCKMKCGKIAHKSQALSKNGIVITASEAPWHVAIYELMDNYVYICGGTIVSPTIVISAAHCFWDETTAELKNSKYKIVVGENFRSTSITQIEPTHVVNVKEVQIPSEFLGVRKQLLFNVAYLKLETPLQFSEAISPICIFISYLRIDELIHMQSNGTGFINTFGQSSQLEIVKMKTLSYDDCIANSPINTPLANDKFCAYSERDASLCRRDAGAGFVVEWKSLEEGDITYYIDGVVSNALTSRKECLEPSKQDYVAITGLFQSSSPFDSRLEKAIIEETVA